MVLDRDTALDGETFVQAKSLPYHFANRHKALLLQREGAYVLLTVGHPPAELLSEVSRWLREEYSWEPISEERFSSELMRHYQHSGEQASALAAGLEGNEDLAEIADALPAIADLMSSDDDAPVIRLLNALIAQAIREHASDIHIEVFEDHVSIRFRVDGVLHEVMRQQRALASMLVSPAPMLPRSDRRWGSKPSSSRVPPP